MLRHGLKSQKGFFLSFLRGTRDDEDDDDIYIYPTKKVCRGLHTHSRGIWRRCCWVFWERERERKRKIVYIIVCGTDVYIGSR